MKLRVHKVVQTSSGGDHVTIYEAVVDLVPGKVEVEILGVYPKDAHSDDVVAATDAIRRGAAKVLESRGLGAIIRLERVVIHPVDFKPRKFEQHTAEELIRILSGVKNRYSKREHSAPHSQVSYGPLFRFHFLRLLIASRLREILYWSDSSSTGCFGLGIICSRASMADATRSR